MLAVMPPVAKKVGDADESYSWVDPVKASAGASRYKNGSQYVDPRKVLVAETQDEMCDSVGSLSLQSSPGSVNGSGSNMVSPEKTMLAPRDMMVSATADGPSSKYQSRTLDDNCRKHAVRYLDGELASTKDTAAPFEQSAPLGIAEVETTHNTKRTTNKRGKVEADYVCLQMLKTVMAQESSIAAMLKEEGSKKSKKDLFKEIGQA
jgi:hypothetical protein